MQNLRVLVIEDSEDDAELVLRTLRKAGYVIEHRCVASAQAMAEALTEQDWDLITSDHHMPDFSSDEALELLKQRGLDIPFFVISGRIGEDAAIAAMKAGANDYIMKDRLARLAPAVARELKEVTLRREHAVAQARLAHLAHYDPLTGLPNRILFNERLNDICSHNAVPGLVTAVLLLSVDRFDTINVSLGHEMGDLLLCAMPERLAACLGAADTLARFEGDQFGILLLGMAGQAAVELRARAMFEALNSPFAIDMHELFITASIGIALYPDDDRDVTSLLRDADTALYRAKQRGCKHCEFFTPELRRAAVARLHLESQLRHALDNDGLQVHYQPKLDCHNGQLLGVEALLRWRNGSGEPQSPAALIPVAEETGLIVPVGAWVLREACQQSQRWQVQGYAPLRVAVNLSVRQFEHDNLVEMVERVLAETGLAPQYLELEITESLLLHSDAANLAALQHLHERGVHIALDDFGTGYSSLSYLQRFPIDTLKIDQSFVRGLPDNPDDVAIASAIIGMAHSLNMLVIAEGVESRDATGVSARARLRSDPGLLPRPTHAARGTGTLSPGLQSFCPTGLTRIIHEAALGDGKCSRKTGFCNVSTCEYSTTSCWSPFASAVLAGSRSARLGLHSTHGYGHGFRSRPAPVGLRTSRPHALLHDSS